MFSYKNNVKAPDYVGAYPVLVRDGKAENSSPVGVTGSRGRTAMGVGDGNLIIALVPDGGNDATLTELRRAFIAAGAENAINLDGGGSTQYYTPAGNHATGRNVRGFVGIWIKGGDVRTVRVRTSLNIRSGASLFSSKIGSLHDGDTVTVLEEKWGWCRIASGWVWNAYLKKSFLEV